MPYHTGLPGTYEILPFDSNETQFYSVSKANIPVDYTATNAAHEQDRRRKTSLPKDKEMITNMHLVCVHESQHSTCSISKYTLTETPFPRTAPPRTEPRIPARLPRAQREARQEPREPAADPPRATPGVAALLLAAGRRGHATEREDQGAHNGDRPAPE